MRHPVHWNSPARVLGESIRYMPRTPHFPTRKRPYWLPVFRPESQSRRWYQPKPSESALAHQIQIARPRDLATQFQNFFLIFAPHKFLECQIDEIFPCPQSGKAKSLGYQARIKIDIRSHIHMNSEKVCIPQVFVSSGGSVDEERMAMSTVRRWRPKGSGEGSLLIDILGAGRFHSLGTGDPHFLGFFSLSDIELF